MSRKLPALLLLLAPALLAQFDSATVLGTIKDPQGHVVANSKVTLSNIATGVQQSANTDTAGDYQFFNVHIGEYTLKAESAGFKTATAKAFKVTVKRTVSPIMTALFLGTGSITLSASAWAEWPVWLISGKA